MANRKEIIENCKKYLGRPYVWGGESMEEGGYDCSGYAYNVLRDSGFAVNRTTADGYRGIGKEIPASQKKEGDLLYFGRNGRATHIAFYAGDGKMYESIGSSSNTKNNPGKGVVYSNAYRRSDLMEVRTLFDGSGGKNPNADTAQDINRSWLQRGDKGEKVKDMQIMLIGCGYSCGKDGADGDFGGNTEKALLKFQHDNALKEDGLYGNASKAKLESVYSNRIQMEKTEYKAGGTYTLQAEMKVREGAGTTFRAKRHSELTEDGRNHDADGDGCLDKGTRVTCKEVKKVGGDAWIRTPSGWIAAVYKGKIYIK